MIYNVDHYLGLIESFIDHNPIAREAWQDIIKFFHNILLSGFSKTNLDTFVNDFKNVINQIKSGLPSINSIYNWLKSVITKQGGVGGILKHFEKRIKYDMIQSIINPWRTPSSSGGNIIGSGHCTVYPLKWWQNCPDNHIPVGHRGWSSYSTHSDWACHKWYQLLSGELLCQESSIINPEDQKALQIHAFKIIKVVTNLKNSEKTLEGPTGQLISEIISKVLTLVSLIPGAAPVVKTITIIFKIILTFAPPSGFIFILDDILDICYNVVLTSNSSLLTDYINGDKELKDITPNICSGPKQKLLPHVNDSVIAQKTCPNLQGDVCYTNPQATCSA